MDGTKRSRRIRLGIKPQIKMTVTVLEKLRQLQTQASLDLGAPKWTTRERTHTLKMLELARLQRNLEG